MKLNVKIVIIIFVALITGLMMILYFQQKTESTMPTQLHPTVAEKRDRLIRLARQKDITLIITDGFRSIEDQDALYSKGRTTSGNIVTHVKGGSSYHNYGLAIDFALQLDDGDVIWSMTHDGNNNDQPDWLEVVELAKELGFEWGGDWSNFRDYPHLQMDFGLSIYELRRGKRPPTPRETNNS